MLGGEFPSSGEDSFVAVVVTKLTGALLFILLLTMVIMALIPRAAEVAGSRPEPAERTEPLAITTPEQLPEAIVGRPYTLAVATSGAQGPLRWTIQGELPEGLAFDNETARIHGVPKRATTRAQTLQVAVTDGTDRAKAPLRLVVYEPSTPLAQRTEWLPKRAAMPIRSWLDHGFGFLVLILVHMVGMNTLTGLEQRSARATSVSPTEGENGGRRRRFVVYRFVLRLTTLLALGALAAWLVSQPS